MAAVAALVRDADDEAVAGRVERQLERLRGDRSGTRQAGGAGRLAQDLDRAERGVLGGAAAGHDDRLAGSCGGGGSPSRGPPPGSAAPAWRARIRRATAGSAAIMSVMW